VCWYMRAGRKTFLHSGADEAIQSVYVARQDIRGSRPQVKRRKAEALLLLLRQLHAAKRMEMRISVDTSRDKRRAPILLRAARSDRSRRRGYDQKDCSDGIHAGGGGLVPCAFTRTSNPACACLAWVQVFRLPSHR